VERIPRAVLAVLVLLCALAAGAVTFAAPDGTASTITATPRSAPQASLTPVLRPAPRAARGLRLTRAGDRRYAFRLGTPVLRRVRSAEVIVDGRVRARLSRRAPALHGLRGEVSVPASARGVVVRVVVRHAGGVDQYAARLPSQPHSLATRRPVKDTSPPTVTITAPAASATVAGRVDIRADAADAVGVARVEFRVDGVLLFSDTAAPYGDAGVWDTAAYANGTHTIEARAIDARGNSATSRRSVTVSNAVPPPGAGGRVLWGAYIDGTRWGFGDAPWDVRTIERFEAQAGKRVSIIHWGQPWYRNGVPQPFYPNDYTGVRNRGAIPMVNWNSWEATAGGAAEQPAFRLREIINGRYDSYIRSWATGARDWGKPLFLRFNHEMNGTWYPWSEVRNGNAAGEYVQAWRHVHGIFRSVGATNVTWVWSPNTIYPGSIPLASLYPGDAYVDWVAMDGYNWGTNPAKPASWRTFSEVFRPTYDALGTLAPGKPVMIAETGSSEWGGSKASWIADGIGTRLLNDFPNVRALVWFDWNADGMDWVIESSASSQAAFASAISNPRYTTNEFATLSGSPIAAP